MTGVHFGVKALGLGLALSRVLRLLTTPSDDSVPRPDVRCVGKGTLVVLPLLLHRCCCEQCGLPILTRPRRVAWARAVPCRRRA